MCTSLLSVDVLLWTFQAVLPGSAPVFKEGFVMKKNIMEAPHKKGA